MTVRQLAAYLDSIQELGFPNAIIRCEFADGEPPGDVRHITISYNCDSEVVGVTLS